jgi:hypothetical protein
MLRIIAGCRLVRFVVDASLAIVYGREIIAIARSPKLQDFIVGLVVVSLVGSAWSIVNWILKSQPTSKGGRKPQS